MTESRGKMVSRRTLIGGGATMALAGGAAFALRDSGVHHPMVSSKTLNRGNGAEPDSLDPHKAQGAWEMNIIGDMFMGLMTEDAAGNPIPGAAESYRASADGLTYTFRLRDHVWSDGAAVTAHDFVFAFRRVLDPKTAAQYASILYPVRNAERVNAGKLPVDQVGIRALDDRTLVISFEFQVPYIAELLTHIAAYAVPRHVVERHGEAWLRPENIATNGPYILAEWIPNDHIRLRKNPYFYDAKNVRIENVVYYPTQDYGAALKRFRAGEFDLTNNVPSQEIDWLRSNLPSVLRISPFILSQYVQFNLLRKPFDDVRVRTALSLGIDREIIASRVMRAGERPAYAYIPPHLPRYPGKAQVPFRGMPMAQRVAKAKALLKAAGFGPGNALSFEYSFQNQTDARLVAVALQAMWKDIGVETRLAPAESQVHYNSMRRQNYTVAWSGWIADYRDAKNYLFIWQTSGGDMNVGKYSNPNFDSLVARSDSERDPVIRARMLQDAEQMLLDDAALAPVYFGVSRALVSPQVKGWIGNDVNVNHSRYLWLDRKQPIA